MVVVLAPKDCEKLVSVYLPNPKEFPSIEQQLYYYDEDNLRLYEQVQYYDEYRSWFLGDRLQQRGEMVFMTKIDPLFIFVPILIKFSSDRFRSIDDICSSYDEVIRNKQEDDATKHRSTPSKIQGPNIKPSQLRYALAPNIKWENVADIKQVDDEIYMRYSEDKTLDWLTSKFDKTMIALESVMSEPQKPKPSKATLMSYACDLINVYVPPILIDKFKTKAKIALISANDTSISSDARTPVQSSTNGKRTSSSSTNDQTTRRQQPAGPRFTNAKTKSSTTTVNNGSNKKPNNSQGIMRFFGKKP